MEDIKKVSKYAKFIYLLIRIYIHDYRLHEHTTISLIFFVDPLETISLSFPDRPPETLRT